MDHDVPAPGQRSMGGEGVDRRGVAVISSSHVVDDFCQGQLPALFPFLVLHRHLLLQAASGLTLADLLSA